VATICEADLRNALDALCRGVGLGETPLLSLTVVHAAVDRAGLEPTVTNREAALGDLLADLIRTRLASERDAPLPVVSGMVSGMVPAATAEAHDLVADFQADAPDREAWSCLYHRYVALHPLRVQQIAMLTQPNAASGAKQVHRRTLRGLELLAKLLRELEREAARTGGRQPAGHGQGDELAGRGGAAGGDLGAQGSASPFCRHNLPRRCSSFVGRESDQSRVKQRLAEAAILTLAGPGGVGKTRLAIEVARAVVHDYADGAWFVDLAPLTDSELVPGTVARVLGVAEPAGGGIGAAALATVLAPRRLLIVLDNCEHVVQACADLVATLLATCPDVRFLATSREPLGIEGEHVWRVPPLATPGDAGPGEPVLERIGANGAVRLFVDRARAVRVGFTLGTLNAGAIAAIVRRLDGLPLAIELAARWVNVLSVDQIAARLDNRFALLVRGLRTAPSRTETLRGAVTWSYDLLGPADRALFDRLSVFAGSFDLEAAEAIGGRVAPFAMAGDAAILESLWSLASKSLVMVEVAADDARRYRLIETLSAYGRERLAERGALDTARQDHAAYFLCLAERAEEALRGPDAAAWRERLEAAHHDLRQALRWAVDHGATEAALEAGAGLWRFWHQRGYLAEGRSWLGDILALPASPGDAGSRADAHNAAGGLAYYQGAAGAARCHYEAALALWRELGDQAGTAKALNNMGNVARDQGRYAEARAHMEESLAIKRALGDQSLVATTLYNLAATLADAGDLEAAVYRYTECQALCRAHGYADTMAHVLVGLGSAAVERGELAEAEARLEEGLCRFRTTDYALGVAEVTYYLGVVAMERGDLARARALGLEASSMHQRIGGKSQRALALDLLGDVELRQGNIGAAVAFYAGGVGERRAIGVVCDLTHSLDRFARVALARGAFEQAVRLAGASALKRAANGRRRGPVAARRFEELVRAAREPLDPALADAAWRAGEGLTLEAALADALRLVAREESRGASGSDTLSG